MISRRDFFTSAAGFGIYALLIEAHAMVPSAPRDNVTRWLQRQDELARGLSSGDISQLDWHRAVSELANEVDLQELAYAIRRADTRSIRTPLAHEPTRRFIAFRSDRDELLKVSYGAAVFSFEKDSVIAPHGHKHMASAHLVIEGKLRIRQYDRMADDSTSLVLRPTSDEIVGVGHAAAMTSSKDNVHWFAARSEHAMTFDIVVDKLDPGEKSYEVQPVDIADAVTLKDGTVRALLISSEASRRRYTAQT